MNRDGIRVLIFRSWVGSKWSFMAFVGSLLEELKKLWKLGS